MRATNYSFYGEFSGPEDRAVCGRNNASTTASRKGSGFAEAARRAVAAAVAKAVGPGRRGYYGKAEVGAGNETVYVLVDCWRNLNESSCSKCLERGSESMLGCLPWSEGRALNTGCFMRYSDRDFLNKEPSTGTSRGDIYIYI